MYSSSRFLAVRFSWALRLLFCCCSWLAFRFEYPSYFLSLRPGCLSSSSALLGAQGFEELPLFLLGAPSKMIKHFLTDVLRGGSAYSTGYMISKRALPIREV